MFVTTGITVMYSSIYSQQIFLTKELDKHDARRIIEPQGDNASVSEPHTRNMNEPQGDNTSVNEPHTHNMYVNMNEPQGDG